MATTTTTTMAKAMPMATRAGTIITTATPIRTRGRTWPTRALRAQRGRGPGGGGSRPCRRLSPARACLRRAHREAGRRDPSDLRRDSRRAPQGRHLARRIRLFWRRLRRDAHRRGRRVHRRRAVGRRRGAHHRTGQARARAGRVRREHHQPRLVQQIARETGAKVGGTLYSDALSKPGQPGATYLEMFEWNARQLAAALQP